MISVILTSHNGESTLPLTLDALGKLLRPGDGVEFIAVDNASTDHTPNLLREAQDSLPLTVLSEPRPGKSFALNHALRHARGDLVVFTDDDVIPHAEWLEA